MKANTPSECPRGPHRRAYTPAPTTARNARSRATGTPCSAAASVSTGRPTTGRSAVVTACPRTVGSVTVNSASRAARPPVMAAASECPAAPHRATASPMPRTARDANRSRIRPGSCATNAVFSKLSRPLRLWPGRTRRVRTSPDMRKAPQRSRGEPAAPLIDLFQHLVVGWFKSIPAH